MISTAATEYWAIRDETYPGGVDVWIADTEKTLQAPYRTQILEALRPYAPESVYEIGCHMGMNLTRAREAFSGVRVGGCDLSAIAITHASERFPEGLSNFQVGLIEEIVPYWHRGAWDVMLSCYTLAYIAPDVAERVVQQMRRVAKRAVILAEPSFSPPHEREYRHDYAAWLPGARVEKIDPPADSLDAIWVWEVAR